MCECERERERERREGGKGERSEIRKKATWEESRQMSDGKYILWWCYKDILYSEDPLPLQLNKKWSPTTKLYFFSQFIEIMVRLTSVVFIPTSSAGVKW